MYRTLLARVAQRKGTALSEKAMYRTLLATCGSAERHCAQRKSNVPHVARNVWLSGKALRSSEKHVTKEIVPMSEIVSASRPRTNRTALAVR